MGSELRDYGGAPFEKGDLDFSAIKNTLALGRRIDEFILEKLGKSKEELNQISEIDILSLFNQLLDDVSLQQNVEIENLRLSPQTQNYLPRIQEALIYGKPIDQTMIRELNRALLYAAYPEEKGLVRQFERFASGALLKTNVRLTPVPPSSGNPINGILVNLSAGGIALMLTAPVSSGTRLLLEAEFPDRTLLKTEVEAKPLIKSGDAHIYRFEFKNLPEFQAAKFEKMSRDFNACEAKISDKTFEACWLDCSFYTLCNKPQKE